MHLVIVQQKSVKQVEKVALVHLVIVQQKSVNQVEDVALVHLVIVQLAVLMATLNCIILYLCRNFERMNIVLQQG